MNSSKNKKNSISSNKDLKNFTLEELKALVLEFGEKPYKATQLYSWLYKKSARTLNDMTDVSKTFRAALQDSGFFVGHLSVLQTEASQIEGDGTVKLLLGLSDGFNIECVLIPDAKRLTLCLSTQTGCALDCGFCMTGKGGVGRNLTLSELTGQVQAAQEYAQASGREARRVTNIVLMGMGEPLLNYDRVVKFLHVLTDSGAFGYSVRKVTVSTAGIVPAIEKLGKETQVNLAVSLNATTDAVRERLMPINKKYPLRELMSVLRRYPLKKGRNITFEYVLIKDVNDSSADAGRLARLLRGIYSKINLIPFNPFPGCNLKSPSHDEVEVFREALKANGLSVSVRVGKGTDISAACGQLRGIKKKRGR